MTRLGAAIEPPAVLALLLAPAEHLPSELSMRRVTAGPGYGRAIARPGYVYSIRKQMIRLR